MRHVQAIFIAVMVSLGWQLFGGNWAVGDPYTDPRLVNATGAVASLPPSQWCPHEYLAGIDPGAPSYLTWYFAIGVYNIPLNIFCLINVHIRPLDCLGPFLVGQVALSQKTLP